MREDPYAAAAMVLVVSRAANKSQEIRKELALASTQRLFVLPARIENFKPTKGFENTSSLLASVLISLSAVIKI